MDRDDARDRMALLHALILLTAAATEIYCWAATVSWGPDQRDPWPLRAVAYACAVVIGVTVAHIVRWRRRVGP